MRISTLMSFIIPTMFIIPASVVAQTTPWGDPDLQGVWNNQTPTPLERPTSMAEKEFFTEEEANNFEGTTVERLRRFLSDEVPLSGELTDIWLEAGQGRVAPSLRTSRVVDPPNGRIPYTLAGRARWQTLPAASISNRHSDGPEGRNPPARCLWGPPLLPNPFYANYHQIFQTPEYVAILSEVNHDVRLIPLTSRPHIDRRIAQRFGDSRGWWEGKTLVVETTNFHARELFRGATQQMRLVERFTRLDAETIDYRVTISDPETFERPWTVENPMRKSAGPIYEFACHEGNYSMTGILAGARAEESRAQGDHSPDEED